ncbi:hypothetical protein KUCAC02_009883, partial [Chaenocephalus aceratus]
MVLGKAPLSVHNGTMTKGFEEINPAANAADDTSAPPTELKTVAPEQPDPSRIEVVSVTEEDLPTVETPNTLNVSPLGSFVAVLQTENSSAKPEDTQPPAAPSPIMPITKVQPFMHEEDLEPDVMLCVSMECISAWAQCDGQLHCDNGEDELGCGSLGYS